VSFGVSRDEEQAKDGIGENPEELVRGDAVLQTEDGDVAM
jgi:hypothetical protein